MKPYLATALILICYCITPPQLIAQTTKDNLFNQTNSATAKKIKPESVIHWQAISATVYKEGIIEASIRLITEQDFTLYQDHVEFYVPESLQMAHIMAPETKKIVDPITGQPVAVYTGGEFRLYLKPRQQNLDPHQDELVISVKSLGCTTVICLFPFTVQLELPLYFTQENAPIEIVRKLDNLTTTKLVANTTQPHVASSQNKNQDQKDFSVHLAELMTRNSSFFIVLLLAFLGGLLTNATPCVAPMIPITIRILAQQTHKPLLNSSLYALGIMLTYSSLGIFAAFTGTMFGAFMSLPWVNVIFSVVMLLLGASMLGFIDLSRLQHIGGQIGSGKNSFLNSFLMGTGAGLVAAPCTGPVLGILLTLSLERFSPAEASVFMASYSLGFALPYVFLGLASQKATQIRIPLIAQLGIKYLFAAVMFGLSFYYLRVPLYNLLKILRPYWGSISLVSVSAGAIMTIIWLIKPQLQRKSVTALLPTVILGLGIFATSQWVTQAHHNESLHWYTNKQEAYQVAGQSGKFILIDHWAEWCEACKKMEITTFQDPQVIHELSKHWVLLKLDMTESTDDNDSHMELFNISGLPTIVLLPPNGDISKKNNLVGFLDATTLLEKLKEYRQSREI